MTDTLTKTEILRRLSACCVQSGSIRKFAKSRGISASLLAATLAGDRDVSTTVAVAVGYMPVVTFVPIRSASNGA